MRCRCPPDSDVPRSPTAVSSCSGRFVTKLSAWASRSARHASSSPRPSRSSVTLPRTLSSNTNGICGTSADVPVSDSSVNEGNGTSSRVIRPPTGSTSRTASDAIVDFPEPVAPTRATVLPGGTAKDTSRSTSGPSAYAKSTPSNRNVAGSDRDNATEP
jgi:hypothetical protein